MHRQESPMRRRSLLLAVPISLLSLTGCGAITSIVSPGSSTSPDADAPTTDPSPSASSPSKQATTTPAQSPSDSATGGTPGQLSMTRQTLNEVGGLSLEVPDGWHKHPNETNNGQTAVLFSDSPQQPHTGEIEVIGPVPKSADPRNILKQAIEMEAGWEGLTNQQVSPVGQISTVKGAAPESVGADTTYQIGSQSGRSRYAVLVKKSTGELIVVRLSALDGSPSESILQDVAASVGIVP